MRAHHFPQSDRVSLRPLPVRQRPRVARQLRGERGAGAAHRDRDRDARDRPRRHGEDGKGELEQDGGCVRILILGVLFFNGIVCCHGEYISSCSIKDQNIWHI